MSIGGVVINFAAKTADAIGDVNKLGRSLSGVGKDADTAGGKKGIGGFFSSMSSSLPVIGAVVGGIAAAGVALIDMSKAALEDKQQADTLATTLGNIPGITQSMIDKNAAWIDSMELATLVSDTELRVAISKLTLATGSLDEAQKLVALSTDVAAGSGKSFATVADAMAKAAAGNTAQLQRMFPWLDKNKDGTVTLKEAQDGLGKSFKGAADKAAQNDPWKRIQVIWGQISEALGGVLLPLIDKFGKWFADSKNRENIEKVITKISEMATALGTDLVDAVKKAMAWLKDPKNQEVLKKWADDFSAIATAVGGLISKISTLKEWTDKLPSNWVLRHLGLLPSTASAPASGPAPTGTATTTSAPPAPTPPPVIVTDEQIYRAISRLIMRGDARNGRLVVVG